MSERETSKERTVPISAESEEAVLCCVMNNPIGLMERALEIPADFFFVPAHAMLFGAVCGMMKRGVPVEMLSVTQHLIDSGMIEQVGGAARITEIFGTTMLSDASFEYHLGILKDKLWLRVVIERTTKLLNTAYCKQDEAAEVLNEAQAAFFELSTEGRGGKQWHELDVVVDECVTKTEQMISHRGHISPGAIATGFTELDRRTMGLRPGELVVIGARPAMGKTALAMNIGTCVALGNGQYVEFDQPPVHVCVITTEMSRFELVDRQLVALSGVNLGKISTGMFSRQDTKSYLEAAAKMREGLMSFIDTGSLSIQELLGLLRFKISKIRSVRGRAAKVVVIVDYVQRLCSETKRSQGNRNLEIAEITSGLKAIAKDMGAVVIALAQVSREAERRADCKPSLADLRESGDIEADADMVGLLWRKGYYEKIKASSRDDGAGADEILDNRAELIMAKYRRGSPEPIPLIWDGPRTQFSSLTDHLFSNNAERREAGYESRVQPRLSAETEEDVFP